MSRSQNETSQATTEPQPAATPRAAFAHTGANDVGVPAAAGPRGLPRPYWLLWGGMLLNRLGGSVFFLLAVYLTRERGLSAQAAGLVLGLYAAGGIAAGPLGGSLADRLGRRATLLIGTAGAGTLMLLLGAARSTATIVAVTPLLGFFTDLCRPPLQAAVADVVAPPARARAYGLLYWAVNLGFAGAATLGGALAEHNFTLLFVIDALTTFAYGAIVFVGVPETRPGPGPQRPTGRPLAALMLPFHDRVLMSFVFIQLPLMLAFAQVIVALPLDMRAHGLGTAHIGWLLGLNGVMIVAAQPLALRLLRRFSHAQWLVAGAALTGIGLGVNALAGGALIYVVASLLWTLGEIGFSTGAPALVADLSPIDRRGAYQGTLQLAWGIANTCAPVVGTMVLEHLGGRFLWLGCLGTCLVAAVLHRLVTARRRVDAH